VRRVEIAVAEDVGVVEAVAGEHLAPRRPRVATVPVLEVATEAARAARRDAVRHRVQDLAVAGADRQVERGGSPLANAEPDRA
jgi:hypothetical protein